MSTEEKPRSKESEAADNMESEMEGRDESRSEDERAEQQDPNQGMDTGTHPFYTLWSQLGSLIQNSQ